MITNKKGLWEFQMKGITVCLDNVSFVLCPPFEIKETEMASMKTLIKISNSSKEKQILLFFFPLFEVSVKSFVITQWLVILKVTSKAQGATNRILKVQMYGNRFVVYAKCVEAVQRFLRQYNVPLLSYVFFDPSFFID